MNLIKLRETKSEFSFYSSLNFEKIILLLVLSLFFQPIFVGGIVGEDNVTQISLLDIGNSPPVITNITIDNPISLIPNSTKTVLCSAIVQKYEGDSELKNASAEIYNVASSFYGDLNDNNYHYENNSCVLDTSYGDIYSAQVNCTFDLVYYSNPGDWNCTLKVYDNSNFYALSSNSTTVETLLALALPDSIDYGSVNATSVSLEQFANVTNYGNVQINLTLEGYAQTRGDNKAMNCSLGSIGYIGIDYEKYNLTNTNPGDLTLTQFEANYTNLTSTAVTKRFELNYRQNDVTNKAINSTYWRIYVPKGVAGTCTGNIIFGATQL